MIQEEQFSTRTEQSLEATQSQRAHAAETLAALCQTVSQVGMHNPVCKTKQAQHIDCGTTAL